MLRNYFKTAWRNLTKNKLYSLLNITGLTVGLSVGMLILLWVQHEKSFDSYHSKASDIYKLENLVGTGASQQIWQSTVAPIAIMAKAEVPEVKASARIMFGNQYSLFKYQDKVFEEERMVYTDASLFSIFDFEIIRGQKNRPFADDYSVVLTEKTASRYFGDEDPIGKVILADDKTSFTVTSVIRDFPDNSSIQADMFFALNLYGKEHYQETPGSSLDNDFHEFNYATFLLLQPGTNITALSNRLRDIHLRNKPDDTDLTYLLMPLENLHLYKSDGSNAGIESVRMFTIIALLILVIACINYVNLSTARSMLRSKEVSLRKIVGAAKYQLFFQFIVETTLLFIIAAALSLGLMVLLLPSFNAISGKQLVLDPGNLQIWRIIGLTIGSSLVASSIYPALLLSSFEPLKALKGKISARVSDAVFRKVLVVTQFVFSVVLIAGTFIISRQLQYIRSKELGYDKSHVFSLNMRSMAAHYEVVKESLLKQPGVLDVTRSSGNLVQLDWQSGDNEWDGKKAGETMMVNPVSIDKDFIPFFHLEMVQGANFSGAVADSSHFIVNEAAVRQMAMTDAIGKRFRLWDIHGTIIGVAKDFHSNTLKSTIAPAVFFYRPATVGRIFVKTTGADAPKAIAAAEKEFKKYNPGYSFSYAFMDDTYNQLYQSEQKTGWLFNAFAAIAILISCLGLFGLAAYTAQLRTREIGVRKVLGASVSGIIGLLAKDFLKLVMIAIIIAIPLAWWAMDAWLSDFAYKIALGWQVFALAGGAALLIAVLTISFQSVRASLANPVKSLRTE